MHALAPKTNSTDGPVVARRLTRRLYYYALGRVARRGPETGRLASDISRGAPLSSNGPTDRDEQSHSEPGTTVKEGSTLWTSTAPPRFFSLSLSLSLFKISPPLSLAREIFPSLSPLWRSVFFAAFASRPAVHSILTADESEFPRVYSPGLPITANT